MPSKKTHLFYVPFLYGLIASLSACLSLPQVETPIHHSPQGQVILKTFTEPSGVASHPTIVDVTLLQEMLRGLQIQEHKELLAALISGEEEKRAVFTEQELQFLTPYLLDAFAQATPEEYVWFQLINKESTISTSTSGHLYISQDLLQLGLDEFQADRRHTKLSSKASFFPTRVKRWTLDFFPAQANHQDSNAQDSPPIQGKIGSVAIAMNAFQHAQPQQESTIEEQTPAPQTVEEQNPDTKDLQGLQKEIEELQQQLEGQNRKLRELKSKLEQTRGLEQ